jgi:hypothetical protein
MKRLRASGIERGVLGTGAPGGMPGCGTAIEPVAKWAITSSATISGFARNVVIAELRASNP